MIVSKYNKEDNIIYMHRSGDVYLEDIITNIKNNGKNLQSLKNVFVLEDIRESTTKFKEKDYPKIVEEVKNVLVNIKKIYSALVVENIQDTALSLLFEMISENVSGYEYKTFCTVDAAKKWLFMKQKDSL